eukprot:6180667-Pleurochrysis_carterae.AAC.1
MQQTYKMRQVQQTSALWVDAGVLLLLFVGAALDTHLLPLRLPARNRNFSGSMAEWVGRTQFLRTNRRAAHLCAIDWTAEYMQQ